MTRLGVLASVRTSLRKLGVPSRGETIVVALSGGADSVALLDVLSYLASENALRIVAAHLDHGLRPDSGEDVVFCAALCRQLGVSFRTARADVRGRQRRDKRGIEDAARLERYAFLRQVKDAEGAALVAVAHTEDDQAETVLLRLVRGSGALGLGAMKPIDEGVVRPLLGVSRAEIVAHLRARGLAWREDPSNDDRNFLRNRVRHELIPYLEARLNPSIRKTLARSARLMADEADAMAERGAELLRRIRRPVRAGVSVTYSSLLVAPRAVARAALREALAEAGGLGGVGSVHIERILDLAASAAPSGRRLPLPGGREAVFSFDELCLGPRLTKASAFSLPLAVPGRVDLPGGVSLLARAASGPAVSKMDMAIVTTADGPLTVRTRRPGDRVRADGRDVSLKRFLMACRVPAAARAGLPLVASGPRVLFIPGQPVEAERETGGPFVRIEVVEGRRAVS